MYSRLKSIHCQWPALLGPGHRIAAWGTGWRSSCAEPSQPCFFVLSKPTGNIQSYKIKRDRLSDAIHSFEERDVWRILYSLSFFFLSCWELSVYPNEFRNLFSFSVYTKCYLSGETVYCFGTYFNSKSRRILILLFW